MARDVIAHRVFKVDAQDVACRFFRPEGKTGSYFCHYEIDWPEQSRRSRAGGVDEVQAVLLAMQKAHTDLLIARNRDGRKVEWLDEQSLGLPIAGTLRDWDPDNRF